MKDVNPLVSVVIPIGHLDHFLQDSLESVANSSYLNYEAVLVCPTQIHSQVIDVASRVFGETPHIVLRETGKGLPAALNQAISAANGEYIARMDADDFCFPERLGAQVAFLRQNPGVAVLGSQINYICEHNHIKGKSRYPKRISKRAVWKNSGTPIAHPTAMFTKSGFLTVGKYNPKYEVCEDQDLWFRFLKSGDLVNLKLPLVSYRQHPGQISEARQDKIRGFSLIAFIANGLIHETNRHLIEEKLARLFESGGVLALRDSLPSLRNELGLVMYLQTKWLLEKVHQERSLQKTLTLFQTSKSRANQAHLFGEFLGMACRYPIHTLSFAGDNFANLLRTKAKSMKFQQCPECARSPKNSN